MPLTVVRQEVANRFAEVQSFLTQIKESEKLQTTQSQEIHTRKGLFIVLLYGSFEYALTRSVVEFTGLISNLNVEHCHINETLYALALDSQLTSCAMVSREHRWQKRLELFVKQNSGDLVKLSESAFLNQLENVWTKTVRKTFNVLGIGNSPLYHPKISQYIDEVVDKRNAVAHGRDSAATVGQAYTVGRLQTLLDEISTQTQYMMICFEQNLVSKEFIRVEHRHVY